LVVFGGDDPAVAWGEWRQALQLKEQQGSEEGPASQRGIAQARHSLRREMTAMIPGISGDGGGTPAARTGKMTRLKVRKLSTPPMRSEVVRRGVPADGAMMAVEAAFRW
jgi:hypothetical protein